MTRFRQSRFLLDTNVLSHARRDPQGRVAGRLRTHQAELAVSVIAAAELRYGIAKNPGKTAQGVAALLAVLPVLDFTNSDAETYGTLRFALERQGTPVPARDLLIASQALSRSMTLVTNNAKDFQRIPDLSLSDWTVAAE